MRRGDCVRLLKDVTDERGHARVKGCIATVRSAAYGKVEVYWTDGHSCSLRWSYAMLKDDEVEAVERPAGERP